MNKEFFELLGKLFESNPKVAIIITSIVVGVVILPLILTALERFLTKIGVVKDNNIILFEKILLRFDNMFEKHTISFKTIINMVEIISNNQHSSLTNDQVNNITNITFEYIKKELLYQFIAEYESENINIQENIKNIFETTVKEIDRSYFNLPNTKGKVLSTTEKIISFYEKDESLPTSASFFDRLMIIIISEDSLVNKRNTLLVELNKLTQAWFVTIKNEG